MSHPVRVRRALLFCPADDRRKVEKAARLPADGVILDLEDGVAASRKPEARDAALHALDSIDFGAREVLVRVNPPRTPAGARDLRALARARRPPDAVVVPKVDSGEDVRRVARALGVGGRRRRRLPAILALIESAKGVVNLASIGAAHPRLEALLFGAEDLCGDIGGMRTREGREVLYARSAVALHCAAAGLQAIDTPFVDLADAGGLDREAREAAALGYGGKLAIHPSQIEPILRAFTPTSEEIAHARRLLADHARFQEAGRGVFVLDGRMVDMPMVRAAEAVLTRARRAGLVLRLDPA